MSEYDDYNENDYLTDEEKEAKYKRDYLQNIYALQNNIDPDLAKEVMGTHETIKVRHSKDGALDAEVNFRRAKESVERPIHGDPNVQALAADIDRHAGKKGHARELLAREEGRDSSFFDPSINPNAGRLKE